MLALLATAETGERWRAWLEEKLWGSLEPQQAQSALRRELHRLRKLTDELGVPLIHCDVRSVCLNLASVDVDIRQPSRPSVIDGEFLEGIDIAGEDAFEEWLRETRSAFV